MSVVGISLQFHDAFDAAVARGIIAYAKAKSGWSLRGSGGGLRPLRLSGRDTCDALIVRIESEADALKYAALSIPVVDIAGAHKKENIHRVQNDDFATGRRAGEYLRQLGACSFAFCGVKNVYWSQQRLLGFAEAVGVAFLSLPRFERNLSWWQHTNGSSALRKWLRQLPPNSALFCCNDLAGVKALTHCLDVGLQIPKNITLLGVDDEDLLCNLCNPTLSSIRLDCTTIGYQAAALVDELLSQSKPRSFALQQTIIIVPQEVVERESTTILLESDPVVAKAIKFIKDNLHYPIGVADVVGASAVSRRNLEVRFKNARGITLHQEITERRLDQACKLLKQTDLTIETIANECAFPSVQRFHVLFKRAYGMTPGQWRIPQRVEQSLR